MKVETIINKETNEPYLTKDGHECQDFILEVGDLLIPQQEKPSHLKADDKRKYPENRLLAVVKSNGQELVKNNQGETLLYLKISQTMANQLNGLVDKAGLQIKTKMFQVVEDFRKSDGTPYKKLKIINPQTENYSFEDFSEDGALVEKKEE